MQCKAIGRDRNLFWKQGRVTESIITLKSKDLGVNFKKVESAWVWGRRPLWTADMCPGPAVDRKEPAPLRPGGWSSVSRGPRGCSHR